jgi:RimJ/RimL family protein N-acetyltransferase
VELVIPRLETERLILRELREDDVHPLFELMQDPDVVRYIGDRRIPTQPECWRAIATWIGHWALRGYGLWAVEERASGAFIGRIGLINPLGWPGPELGWTLAKPWWGHGYATEAAARALAWGFEEHGFPELISLIDPDNAASIRVAERLGERRLRETDLMGHRVLVYGISHTEWAARA